MEVRGDEGLPHVHTSTRPHPHTGRGNGDELVVLRAAGDERRSWGALPAGFAERPLFTPAHHGLEQLTLPLELLAARLNVLHSPDFVPPFVRPCRSVITVHDLAFLLYPQFLTDESRRYYNAQIERAVASADMIIAVSQNTATDLGRLLGVSRHKIRVVLEAPANAVARVDGEELASFRRREALEGEFILFVGTLEPRKNLVGLLRAVDLLVRRHGWDGRLVVVGAGGWLEHEVFEVVKAPGLATRVVFAGPRPEQELSLFYSAASLLAMPSFYEGFGIPVLEAMACGTPVVCSNTSSFPEVVGDAALLVAPHDSEALANGLWQVLSDQALRRRLAQAGPAQTAQFSWDRAARETLAVYREAAAMKI